MNWETGRGILFVLSAPSGAGKTTLASHAVKEIPCLRQSVSYTTRAMREGEINGKSYHFVTEDKFKDMIAENRFIEYANVHGKYYGTGYDSLESAKANGHDLLLVIDVQGAAKLKARENIDCVYIFVLPPSLAEMEDRLKRRGTERHDDMAKRMEIAKKEMAECLWYDYIIVNGELATAQQEIASIIRSERLRVNRRIMSFPDFTISNPDGSN